MMNEKSFDFDKVIDRRRTASLKWERYGSKDVIPLWVADMDFVSPPAVLEALKTRIDHGVFGYAVPPGELVEEVLSRLKRMYDWDVDEKWIVWLPGLVTGINLACRAVGKEDDGVMTHVPAYPPFLASPKLSRRVLSTVLLNNRESRWSMDLDAMERSVTAETKVFLHCSPHNPTGRLWKKEETQDLIDFCERHDLVICSDEIWCDLVLKEERSHIPTACISSEAAERTVTLMAPSKTFNIAGLGCSFAVIPNDRLRRRFEHAAGGIVPHVNALGFTAALAAYREGNPWLDALLDYLRDNRNRIREVIEGIPGLAMGMVEATFLAWIDVRDLGLDDPVGFFEEAGIGLSDGKDFGMEGFVRLNFGCPRETLEQALVRIQKAVSDF